MNILHIGMPKAASTFLQSEVFPIIPDYQYIGKLSEKSKANNYIRAATRLIETQFSNIDSYFSISKKFLLSDEDFSVFRYLDVRTISARIKSKFPRYIVC